MMWFVRLWGVQSTENCCSARDARVYNVYEKESYQCETITQACAA